MADLNNLTITGRLTRDATTSTVGDRGTTVTKFGIANNTGFGQYARTQFFNVEVWGKGGAAISSYLLKGKQVGVSGKLENKQYEGRDGQLHDAWTISTSEVTLLASPKGADNSSSPVVQEDEYPTF